MLLIMLTYISISDEVLRWTVPRVCVILNMTDASKNTSEDEIKKR